MVHPIIYYLFIAVCSTWVNATFYGYGLSGYAREPVQQKSLDRDSLNNRYIPDYIENGEWAQSEHQQRRAAKEVESWPHSDTLRILGEVSGLATCKDDKVHVFHRVNVVWDQNSFNEKNVYNRKDKDPIGNDTVLVLNSKTGLITKSWGSRKFYMPHGISVDPQGNVWLTDVALHQVFRFKRDKYEEPDLVLGERFVPGDDEMHFCKPTDVAISSSGVIYISDGYCNSRIAIFSPEGNFVGQFGLEENMRIPHSMTLLESEDLLCVADRENMRILCYTAGLTGEHKAGKLMFNIQHSQLGRVFAIDHIGDVILALNGDESDTAAPKGISLDLATERLVDIWEPTVDKFRSPHDIAVSSDGSSFYVSEISATAPKKIYKFSL